LILYLRFHRQLIICNRGERAGFEKESGNYIYQLGDHDPAEVFTTLTKNTYENPEQFLAALKKLLKILSPPALHSCEIANKTSSKVCNQPDKSYPPFFLSS
jgi:Mlc titration factor MtfA (ptsG expression regulator)